MKTLFALALAVALAVSACAPVPCPGGGTWCQNQAPIGGDGSATDGGSN